MIIVTGANGKLGRTIVEHLLELVPAEGIGVSVFVSPDVQNMHVGERGLLPLRLVPLRSSNL